MKLILNETQLKQLVDIIKESSLEKKYKVLFLGDSLSSGPSFTWNYVLEQEYPNWDVTHIYKGGQTTGWMLTQLKEVLVNENFDLVFIWGGTNDMFSMSISPEKAVNNLTIMANLVVQQNGKPIIFAGYDVSVVMAEDKLKPTYDAQGRMIANLDMMKDFRKKLIKFQNLLEKGIPGAYVIPRINNPNLKTWDNVHVDVAGHKMIADHINKELPAILQGVKKTETQLIPKQSWINILGGLIGGVATQIYDYFFGGGDKLTKKIITDLDKLKNVSDLEFKPGFINYNQDVEPIQVALKLLDYPFPKFGIDGKFGPETEKAIKLFQKDNDLESTGKVNSDLITKLITQIKSNNFTDKDFENLNFTEIKDLTGDLSDELVQNYNVDGEYTAKITNSTINTFKKVLEKENVDFYDFMDNVKKIGIEDPNIAIQQLAMESGYFNPNVLNCKIRSSKGAKGIAQFIPSTEAQYNIDACKVDQALIGYIKLMDYNLKRFKGRVDLAVAGYNSGPFLKYDNKEVYMEALKNNTPFLELKGKVPNETWGYVTKILNL